jgi:L-lactate utilization protein LutB
MSNTTKIVDLKKRWPAHFVHPTLMRELDELEERLAEALEQAQKEDSHA